MTARSTLLVGQAPAKKPYCGECSSAKMESVNWQKNLIACFGVILFLIAGMIFWFGKWMELFWVLKNDWAGGKYWYIDIKFTEK